MRIKDGSNPFAVETGEELEQRYVLVENCWDEELAWSARARYSDSAGESKKVDYFWAIGAIKRIEEDYAKAVFGDWEIAEDENYINTLTKQMLKQLNKWPSPAPPFVKIYAELPDGKQGSLLYDTQLAWLGWMKDRGQVALPTRKRGLPPGTVIPEMPAKLAAMGKEALLTFAEEARFPVPEEWDAETMREVLFTHAPAHMLKDAIERTQEKMDGAASKKKGRKPETIMVD